MAGGIAETSETRRSTEICMLCFSGMAAGYAKLGRVTKD